MTPDMKPLWEAGRVGSGFHCKDTNRSSKVCEESRVNRFKLKAWDVRSRLWHLYDIRLAALTRGALHGMFSCLIEKSNKPKRAKDLKFQYPKPSTLNPACNAE